MQNLNVDGRSISFDVRGEGFPVVLLHAGGSSSRQWRKISEELDGEFRLIAPDLWGFGETDLWDGDEPLSHDHQAQLVADVVGSLGLTQCALVGHSYGGATALRWMLAQSNPVVSVVLIEPIAMPLLKESEHADVYAEYIGMVDSFLGNADSGDIDEAWRVFLDYRNGVGTWDRLSEKKRDRFRVETQSSVKGFHSNLNNPTTLADVGAIQIPATVCVGETTTLPDRRVAELVARAMPNSQLEEVAEAGHMSPLSHPEAVARIIREHMKRSHSD